MWWYVIQSYNITDTDKAFMEFSDLMNLRNDGNLAKFDSRWTMVIRKLRNRPHETILESLYRRQLDKSRSEYPDLNRELDDYDHNFYYKKVPKSYETLREIALSVMEVHQHRLNAKDLKKGFAGAPAKGGAAAAGGKDGGKKGGKKGKGKDTKGKGKGGKLPWKPWKTWRQRKRKPSMGTWSRQRQRKR